MATKILVNGEAGVGKTALLSSLDPETTFVVVRDNKTFPIKLPHMLVTEYVDMNGLLYGYDQEDEDGSVVHVGGVVDKLEAFNDKFGKYPETVVWDTVSQIMMDIIDVAAQKPNVYGSQSIEITKEAATLINFMHEYLELNGVNQIMLNHVIKDKSEDKVEYRMFGQGKFLEKGSFYGIVDESVTLVIEGSYLVAYLKGKNKLARSTLDVHEKMYIESYEPPLRSKKLKDGEEYFVLKEYLDKVLANNNEAEAFRL